jgi:signal transduction histidine kinase
MTYASTDSPPPPSLAEARRAGRLRWRMLASFAVVLIAFVGFGLAVSVSLSSSERAASEILDVYGQSVRRLLRLQRDKEAMRQLAERFVRGGEPSDVELRLTDLEAASDVEVAHLEPALGQAGQADAWYKCLLLRRQLLTAITGAIADVRAGKPSEAEAQLTAAETASLVLDESYEALVHADVRRAQDLATSLDGRLHVTGLLNLLALLLGAIATVALLEQALLALHDYTTEAQRRMEELDRFAGEVMHDVRQPLNALSLILGAADRSATDSRVRAALSRGGEIIQRVNGVAEALLAYARSGAAPEDRGKTELRPLLNEIVEEIKEDPRSTCVRWEVDLQGKEVGKDAKAEDWFAAIGPATLRTILWNLLENAVKFMDPERDRCVSVVLKEGEQELDLRIRDTGRGIPPGAMSRIFEPFYRAENGIPGHGLGLATVKRLVEAHGGSIVVKSKPGRGTELRLVLPRATG